MTHHGSLLGVAALIGAVSFIVVGCSGSEGPAGADGTTGAEGKGSLTAVSEEPSGANCADGGLRVEYGVDDDGNGVLDGAEVDGTSYVCNGEAGTPGEAGGDGADGAASLVSTVAEPAGANCDEGGLRIDYGLDDDANGTLDAGEIDGTTYVCDGEAGSSSLIAVTAEPAGANCEAGGQKIDFGLDDDDDGTLEAGEIDGTYYACDGIVACEGWLHDAGSGLACWYTAPALNMSCNEVCVGHGGFDAVGTRHTGNSVGKHFWPAKADGAVWETIECSSTDNNTNWAADGTAPDGDWRFSACYVNCACMY